MEEMVISSALEEKLKNAESLDEVVQACAEEGIAITKEQLEAFLPSDSEAELSDEALDNVSGGINTKFIKLVVKTVGHVCIWFIREYQRSTDIL